MRFKFFISFVLYLNKSYTNNKYFNAKQKMESITIQINDFKVILYSKVNDSLTFLFLVTSDKPK